MTSLSASHDEKLAFGVKLAYGAGDFGTGIVAALKGFFLLIFLTDVARLEPAAAGSILLITKIWDAVNDPMVGWLSDRTRTRWGRRRPWILFGALPFGLLFFLLWLTPPLGPTAKYFYYLLIALAGDVAFTTVNLPYTALTPELTHDYDERTSLNSFRFAFSIAGSLIAAVAHPLIVGRFDDPRIGLFFVTSDRFVWVIPLAILAGAGIATAFLIPWAMMPDVIEYDELQTGKRREGIFYGFMVFLQKACLALGIYAVGLALSWTGYITPTDAIPALVQPASALAAIRFLMGPGPAAILAVSLVLVYFYPITRTEHARMRAALAARAAGKPLQGVTLAT